MICVYFDLMLTWKQNKQKKVIIRFRVQEAWNESWTCEAIKRERKRTCIQAQTFPLPSQKWTNIPECSYTSCPALGEWEQEKYENSVQCDKISSEIWDGLRK